MKIVQKIQLLKLTILTKLIFIYEITPMFFFNNILIDLNNILILLYCFNLINVLKCELSNKLK